MVFKNTVGSLILGSSLVLSACGGDKGPSEATIAHTLQDATVNKALLCLKNRKSKQSSSIIYSELLKCFPFLETYKTISEEERHHLIKKIVIDLPKSEMTDIDFSEFGNNLGHDLSLLNISEVEESLRLYHEEYLGKYAKSEKSAEDITTKINSSIPDKLPIILRYSRQNSISYRLEMEPYYKVVFDLHRTLKHLGISSSDAQKLYNLYMHPENIIEIEEFSQGELKITSSDVKQLIIAIQDLARAIEDSNDVEKIRSGEVE